MDSNSLGEKLRQYRKRAGMSQFDLELEIETSSGRISKIESGKINPDKETVINIAKVLQLDNYEIASLFDISIPNVKDLFEEVNQMLLYEDEESIIDKTVNDLIFKLGFVASALFLKKDDRIFMVGLTVSDLAKKALAQLNQPLDKLFILSNDQDNLTAKAIRENSPQITNFTREYISPLVSSTTADKIQEVTGDKTAYIVPLSINGDAFGAVAYVKKTESDFEKEKDLLEVATKQIAIALYKANS